MNDNAESKIIKHVSVNLPVGLVIIDSVGDILLVNPAACRILGHSEDDFRTRGWGGLFIDMEKNVDFNNAVIDLIRPENTDLRREVSYLHPNGRMMRLSLVSSIFKDGDDIQGISVIIDDISDIYELHEKEKSILAENAHVQEMRIRSLNKLALAVAHQIRNPMTMIGGFANLMLRKLAPEDRFHEYLQSIITADKRLEEIVKSVTAAAAMPQPKRRRIPLDGIIQEMRGRVDALAARCEHKLEWRIAIEHRDVFVDPETIGKALYEITANALEAYDGKEALVEVTAFRDDDGVHVIVRDYGKGIANDDLPFVFDPFFTTKPVGVGMGLCIAERAIFDHKGKIAIDNRLEKGTKVSVLLPDTD